VVLFHAPALLHANEALALTPKVDGVVLIIHPGMSRRTTLVELGRALDDSHAAKLGFVLIDPGPPAIGALPRPRPSTWRLPAVERVRRNGARSGSASGQVRR
jgi:hypothetical protein